MKYCINCLHFSTGAQKPICSRPKWEYTEQDRDPVTGEIPPAESYFRPCKVERANSESPSGETMCGPEAKFFHAK